MLLYKKNPNILKTEIAVVAVVIKGDNLMLAKQ